MDMSITRTWQSHFKGQLIFLKNRVRSITKSLLSSRFPVQGQTSTKGAELIDSRYHWRVVADNLPNELETQSLRGAVH